MAIKDHFTSRYGEDGVLIEADWKSLEVIVWAFLTKDPVLYKLIREDIDMHRYVGSYVLGCNMDEVTKEQRQTLKPANFNLIYGGTDFNLHRDFGLSQEFAKEVYEAFWKLFPTAKLTQDNWLKEIYATAVLINEYTPKGVQKRRGYYKTPCGRKLFLDSYDTSEYQRKQGVMWKFKRSEAYNLKVQSFATADIHMLALGHLWRESLHHLDKFLLVNTVHDSVILDCKKEYLEFTCNFVKDKLQYITTLLKTKFNIDFDLPLLVEVKAGSSWSNMKEV